MSQKNNKYLDYEGVSHLWNRITDTINSGDENIKNYSIDYTNTNVATLNNKITNDISESNKRSDNLLIDALVAYDSTGGPLSVSNEYPETPGSGVHIVRDSNGIKSTLAWAPTQDTWPARWDIINTRNNLMYLKYPGNWYITIDGIRYELPPGWHFIEPQTNPQDLSSKWAWNMHISYFKLIFPDSRIIDLHSMFNTNSNITHVDFSNNNMPNLTTCAFMFSDCPNLKRANFDNFVAPKLTSAFAMFYNTAIPNIDLSKFYPSNNQLVEIGLMFGKCSKTEIIDLSNFKNVIPDTSTFNTCTSLHTLIFPNMGNISSNYTIDLSYSPLGTAGEESKQALLNMFEWDRVENQLNTLTVQLSTRTKNDVLTDEEKAAITAKGYTIA